MFGNLSGPTLLLTIAVVLISAIVATILIVVNVARKGTKNSPTPEQAAYEAGQKQAALQRAYEAGLNGAPTSEVSSPPAT